MPSPSLIAHITAALLVLGGSLTRAQVPVPEGGAYHSAFVDERGFSGTVEAYESFGVMSEKPLAIAMLYRSWSMYPRLDVVTMHDLRDAGMIPHITWEPWWGNRTDQTYSNQRIIDGEYDAYLRLWADDIKRYGSPVMIRWAHEMNGDWYPWSGLRSGGATTDQFGDPAKADGPERYVAAYRYIHSVFEDEGVSNVDWIWCPNNGSAPDQPWNQPEHYYPGDDVVDWVCVDGYNWGAATYDWGISGWASFIQLFKPMYDRLKVYGKPVMIGEFASADVGGDKAQWISEAYAALRSPAFSLVKAVTWFHIDKETDWRVNSTDRALDAYRAAVGNEHYLAAVATSAPVTPALRDALQFYPVPAVGRVNARITTSRGDTYRMILYDVLGRITADIPLGHLGPGTHYRPDIATALSPGIYIARMEGSSGRLVSQQSLVMF